MNNNQFHKEQRRDNNFLNDILEFFSNNSSHPKLLLEVFVRKNFGKNYFNMGSVISVAWRVALLPILLYYIPKLYNYVMNSEWNYTFNEWYGKNHNGYQSYHDDFWHIYIGWYVLLIAFLVFAFIRWFEVMRIGENSTNTSTYNGDINRLFTKLNFLGQATPKMISVVYEPLVLFVVGLIVKLMGQNVGWVIMISSIFYSLGYLSDFRFGNKIITLEWDKIKKNKEVRKIFEGADSDENMKSPDGISLKERRPESVKKDDEPTYVL